MAITKQEISTLYGLLGKLIADHSVNVEIDPAAPVAKGSIDMDRSSEHLRRVQDAIGNLMTGKKSGQGLPMGKSGQASGRHASFGNEYQGGPTSLKHPSQGIYPREAKLPTMRKIISKRKKK